MGKRRGEDVSGQPRKRTGSPSNTGCPFRKRGDRGDATWRGARGNWQRGRRCGCTSCTGTVVMLEGGTSPHPRCARCDIQVPRRALNGRHPGTAQCAKGAERKRRHLAETETRENSERAFEAYGAPIESVLDFKYLGRILTAIDDDWPAVVGNLRKARLSWGWLARVLSREGADPKMSQTFYIAVTQVVLIFGLETWVLTARKERPWKDFSPGSRGRSRGGSCGAGRTGPGTTLRWQEQ